MDKLAEFFDTINRYLGVSTPGELLVNPYFVGLLVVLLLYSLFAGMKYVAIILSGILGTGVIIHYLYPSNTSDLGEILKFVAAEGGLCLVLIYFGFIRE